MRDPSRVHADQIKRDPIDERLLVDARGCAWIRVDDSGFVVDARGFAWL
jgi:hypothetical protein